MANLLQKGWVEFLDRIMKQDPREKWFVTLSFPFNIPRPIADQRRNIWIRRLSQALKDSGQDGKVGYISIPAQQQREVLHFHLIVVANGLDKLDKSRWEKKWREVTGRKKPVPRRSRVKYHGRLKLVSRRIVNGETQEVTKTERVAQLHCPGKVAFKSVDGGTCKILPATPTVTNYLCNRHHFRNEGSDIVLKGIPQSFPNGK